MSNLAIVAIPNKELSSGLRWSLPVALLLWVMMLWIFGRYFTASDPPQIPSEPPIDARIIELPPPPSPAPPKPVVQVEKAPTPVKAQTPVLQKAMPVVVPKIVALVTPPPQPVAPAVVAPPPPVAPTVPSSNAQGTEQLGARALYQPKPKLSEELLDAAMHAVVMARFHIAADGSATVELTQSAPDPRVNQLILKTLKTWRFFPAMQAGKPVASVQEIKVAIDVD
jgi:protein TonB